MYVSVRSSAFALEPQHMAQLCNSVDAHTRRYHVRVSANKPPDRWKRELIRMHLSYSYVKWVVQSGVSYYGLGAHTAHAFQSTPPPNNLKKDRHTTSILHKMAANQLYDTKLAPSARSAAYLVVLDGAGYRSGPLSSAATC